VKFHLNPKKALEESRSLRAAPEQDDTGLILVANGISGSSIKLFPDYVRVTEVKNHKVTEFPVKNIVALQYLKHFTPIGITFTYLEGGENLKVTVGASPTKRPEFDAMEKRIKQIMAGEGKTMQPQQPQVSAYDELAKLAALREGGVVTEQEFQEQKAKLLGTQSANQSEKRFDPKTGRPL
jgi:hypothetical protein